MSKGEKKAAYFARLERYLNEFQSVFVVNVDNVGSNQMHEIRRSLRGKGEVLMGKNTMVRRGLRLLINESGKTEYERLLSYVRGNIGFVFTNSDLKEVRNLIVENRVRAPARAGAIAPGDVIVPAGNTGMEPGQTSFFQALGIPTKIARGTIEITQDINLVHTGEKVGASEATLLNKLNISPFTYGMTVIQVYDSGNTFAPEVLDISADDLVKNLVSVATGLSCISLATDYLTLPAVPHIFINNYKQMLAISIATDYTYTASEKIKELLDNPEALAAAAAAAQAAAAAPAGGAAKEEAAAEEEEESDDDMGFGLFD
ncbi:ribosomal protein P0 (A0) (L10E) [Mycoemilia scoparia]|uniref:60S acidic ribosomal protein P0 n=1 Tax=Mycoemilia scoparia TaxID=417184 RepID=A0A9W8A1U7_9FUNG|nr:ribosomal protein P0 (A0) (L10E) [Mycoemilia scoparia]